MSTATTTDTLIPLVAKYPYDNNIDINSTAIKWKDGYTTYTHPLFNSNIDCSLNNNSIFYLTSSMKLFDIISETPIENALLGDFITLKINSQFVSNVGNELYLTSTSSNDSFIKIIANDDGTYSFFNGIGLYATVSNQEPFDLTMEAKRSVDQLHHQRFNILVQDLQMYITTSIKNESRVGDAVEQRFWSYTKFGPQAGKLRAIGTFENEDYLFTISNFDLNFKPYGLTRDHTWVRYFNDLQNSENNKNVEINESESISGVKVNHLVDLPYNSTINIDNGSMDVNFANMKNIQTSNYEYRKK